MQTQHSLCCPVKLLHDPQGPIMGSRSVRALIAGLVVGHGHILCMQAPAQLVEPVEAASSLSGAMSGLQLDDADSLQLQQALELSMSGAGLEQAVDQALQVAVSLYVIACQHAGRQARASLSMYVTACEPAGRQAKSLTVLCGPGC